MAGREPSESIRGRSIFYFVHRLGNFIFEFILMNRKSKSIQIKTLSPPIPQSFLAYAPRNLVLIPLLLSLSLLLPLFFLLSPLLTAEQLP